MCCEEKDKKCCCCYGPQGPQGVMGFQGPQGPQGPMGLNGSQGIPGLQGPSGSNGKDGAQGPQGPKGDMGAMGPQGAQGIQGVPGLDCDCHGMCTPYLNLYSNLDQNIAQNSSPNNFAVFELQNANSGAADFDISTASIDGKVKVLKSGVYRLGWVADGMLDPPFGSPVPSWGLGLYINNSIVGGSAIAGFSQSPDDDATCLGDWVIVNLNAGDVVQLRNISTFPIFLKSNHPELAVPMTSCALKIDCHCLAEVR